MAWGTGRCSGAQPLCHGPQCEGGVFGMTPSLRRCLQLVAPIGLSGGTSGANEALATRRTERGNGQADDCDEPPSEK